MMGTARWPLAAGGGLRLGAPGQDRDDRASRSRPPTMAGPAASSSRPSAPRPCSKRAIPASRSSSRPRRTAPPRPTRWRISTTQGIDALVILPHNSDELTDPIRQVKAKGVFVTVVDRALSRSVDPGPLRRGQQPRSRPRRGRLYQGQAPASGNVVVIRGLPIVIDEERAEGLRRRPSRAAASRCSTASSATGSATTPSR